MISVIIPIWNSSKTLLKCLDSILVQTYDDCEVIIVDDGSVDKSVEITKSYALKFKNKNIELKILQHKKNMGAPATRNTGFKNSRGEYIIFCDSDVVLEPNTFLLMLETIKNHSEASYVYSSFMWGSKFFRVGEFNEEKLKQGPFIHTTALIRRSDFPATGWDESIKKLQDWDLWLTMLEDGHEGYWIDKTLFKVFPGGIISSWLPSFAYKLMPFLPNVKKYKKAVEIIKKKHHLI